MRDVNYEPDREEGEDVGQPPLIDVGSDLLDLDEVLALVEEPSVDVFWGAVQTKKWPEPDRRFEFDGYDRRGRKRFRPRPRWRRWRILRAIEEVRRKVERVRGAAHGES